MMVKIISFYTNCRLHKMKNHNLLFLMLMYKHLLFAKNNRFKYLGFEPCCKVVDFSDELLQPSNRLHLLSRSSMMMRLMVMLLQNKAEPSVKKSMMRDRLKYIFSPVFSLNPLIESSFELFARIEGRPTYSICRIEILHSPESHLVVLHLKTLCKPPKPHWMDFSNWIGLMPQDDKIYTFDLERVETTREEGPKATQKSFSISATQGEYHAHGKIDNGFHPKFFCRFDENFCPANIGIEIGLVFNSKIMVHSSQMYKHIDIMQGLVYIFFVSDITLNKMSMRFIIGSSKIKNNNLLMFKALNEITPNKSRTAGDK